MARRQDSGRGSASRSTGARRRSAGGGVGRLLAGFLLGAAAVAGGGYLYLHRDLFGGSGGTPAKPVATLTAPPARSIPKPSAAPNPKPRPPFGISEDVFESGARIYHGQCASCHGSPGSAAMPGALPLWSQALGHKAVGVSDHEPADTYAQIAHGIPGKGMPAFAGKLSDTQIWQVSLLLQNASDDLPDPVLHLLRTGKP